MPRVVLDDVDVGDTVYFEVTFRNAAGDPSDPTVVTFRTRDPAGVESADVTYPHAAITKTGTGVFVFGFEATAAGPWLVRGRGTGAVNQARVGYVTVKDDGFA